MKNKKTAVLLMTYGSATVAQHVGSYMRHIYSDKVSKETIQDFEHRYRLVGHSPLVEITGRQAELLQEQLGNSYIVKSAMRHSNPFIRDVVRRCKKEGATSVVGIILSPQFSSFIMEGYTKDLFNAARTAGFRDEDVTIAKPWPAEPRFVALLAARCKAKLAELKILHGVQIPIIFTTHSLPERVVKNDPNYLDELKATVDAVLKKLRMPTLEYHSGYQSAGHSPEKWLKPDLTDILAKLSRKKVPAVLIVPIQFLADHLEILYDLDIAAAVQCAEYRIAYERIELPNTDPLFIKALASVAKKAKIAGH